MRGDFYNGLTAHKEAEPRLGVAYNIKKTNTVLRVSYARVLETPFNENLVLSSEGCNNAVLNPLLGCFEASQATPLAPGWRNEFHAGIEQAFGRYLVFSGEYIWKYTHNGYDFSVLGNTPITFPMEWERSKIPGYAGRVSVPNFHGFSALVVFSSVAARFFTPQLGGAGAVPSAVQAAGSVPFRIDHDERFNQTAHVQYQFGKTGHGWDSTGAMTAAWPPEIYPARAAIAPMAPLAAIAWSTRPLSVPISNFRLDCFAVEFARPRRLPSVRHLVRISARHRNTDRR